MPQPFETPPRAITLPVTDIQRFCMHDGPGVRTVVFLKGCPLRCAWCHNPEGQRWEQEILFYEDRCIGCGACVSACPVGAHRLHPVRVFDRDLCMGCGACAAVCCTEALVAARRDMTVSEIMDVVVRDRSFYGDIASHGFTVGGLTLSGGEPLSHPDGAAALMGAAHAAGLSTAVETSGQFDPAALGALLPVVDLFLWDIKDTDPVRHKRYTGISPDRILQNLRAVDAAGGKTRLRCILVAGVNTDPAHYEALSGLYHDLSHCEGVEFLPYHAYSGSKMCPLGMEDNGRAEWIPDEETIRAARDFLEARNVHLF